MASEEKNDSDVECQVDIRPWGQARHKPTVKRRKVENVTKFEKYEERNRENLCFTKSEMIEGTLLAAPKELNLSVWNDEEDKGTDKRLQRYP